MLVRVGGWHTPFSSFMRTVVVAASGKVLRQNNFEVKAEHAELWEHREFDAPTEDLMEYLIII
jgi:hypothetical protein